MARAIRNELKTAANHLRRDGHTKSADALEAVLEPGGWTMLREEEGSHTRRSDAESNPRSLQGPPRAATSSCRLGGSSLPPGIGLDHRKSIRRARGDGR